MTLRWTTFACWMVFFLPVPGPASAEAVSSLFNGQDLTGWQTVDGKPIQDGWEVVDGEIHLRSDRGRAGNIVTTRQFCNFDLQFEWKITAGTNSGVKYRVRNFAGRVLGCEFQILDDAMCQAYFDYPDCTGSIDDYLWITENTEESNIHATCDVIPDVNKNCDSVPKGNIWLDDILEGFFGDSNLIN